MSRNPSTNEKFQSPHNSMAHKSPQSTLQTYRPEDPTARKSLMTSSDPVAQQSCSRQPPAKFQAQPQADSETKMHCQKQSGSKRKLPGVSQAAKRNIFQQLSMQSDDLNTPMGSKPKEHVTTSDASRAVSHTHRRTRRIKAASSKKHGQSATSRRMDDEDEFMPTQTKQRKRSDTKRKAPIDAIEDAKRVKKPRVPTTTKSDATGTNREERSKSIANSHLLNVSPRHILIGGLLGSQSPAEISTTPFKKPILPPRAAQTLSTPAKPRTKSVETMRLRTPKDLRRRSRDQEYYMSSSPSLSYEDDAKGDWLQTNFDLEIMSSNSKPVPASPNAPSTAISGHADRNDVDSDIRTGDSQTEKSNPFTQRRSGRKSTSFLRRLIGEDQANGDVNDSVGMPHSVQITVNDSTTTNAKAPMKITGTVPPHMLSKRGVWSDSVNGSNASRPRQVLDFSMSITRPNDGLSKTEHNLNESRKSEKYAEVQEERILQRKAMLPSNPSSDDEGMDHYRTKRQSSTALVAKNCTRLTQQHIEIVEMNGPNLRAYYRTLESIPTKHTTKHLDVGREDDTFINLEHDEDAIVPTIYKSSPLSLPSSPPQQVSPSTRSSISAGQEPQTDLSILSSDTEAVEWESSLQTHQRSLHESMTSISNRVLRHI